jgi:pimeloyl-ACP methyl ester carboxylesterase
VIVGSEDISLPVEYAQKIASAIPGASLVVVPESGHLSSLEQPEAVTRAMVEFLEGVMG